MEIFIFLHLFDDNDSAVSRSNDNLVGIFNVQIPDWATEEIQNYSIDDTENTDETPKRNFIVEWLPQQKAMAAMVMKPYRRVSLPSRWMRIFLSFYSFAHSNLIRQIGCKGNCFYLFRKFCNFFWICQLLAVTLHLKTINFYLKYGRFRSPSRTYILFNTQTDSQSIPKLVDKAVANGMHGMAITDHGNMFGIKEFSTTVIRWTENWKRRNLSSPSRCEMYVASSFQGR